MVGREMLGWVGRRRWMAGWAVVALAGAWLALRPADHAIDGARLASTSDRAKALTWLDGADRDRALQVYRALPLAFEPNDGQVDAAVRYLARGAGIDLFLTESEAVLALRPRVANGGQGFSASAPTVLRLRFAGGNPRPSLSAEERLSHQVNYFIGDDPARWHRDVPTYAAIRYHQVYPGIDVLFRGDSGRLKFDLEIAPGADPSQVRLVFDGARGMRLEGRDLVLTTAGGEVRKPAPVCYQEVAGRRRAVKGAYRLVDGAVGFSLGRYDRRRPLVIDPTLIYASYHGGNESNATTPDTAYAIAVDATGSFYVVGYTSAPDFPTASPLQATFLGGGNSADGFVSKFNPTGASLTYSTYIGGSGDDFLSDIAVDAAGNAVVAGLTSSDDFPTQSPVQANRAGSHDAVVFGLSATGATLRFSTYLGGGADDGGRHVGIDGAGNVYVAGFTTSDDFPTFNAIQQTFGGGNDRFVTKLSPAGTTVRYSTYVGGSGDDGDEAFLIVSSSQRYGGDMVVDSAGSVYLTGFTASDDFPTQSAYQTTLSGGTDAFVVKINTAGDDYDYATYLGGSGDEEGIGLAVDSSGRAWVGGATDSTDFPTAGSPLQTTPGRAFLSRLSPTGAALNYSTYLFTAGTFNRFITRLAVDDSGNVYVVGRQTANEVPQVNPIQTGNNGQSDGFIIQLPSTGASVTFGSYYGGSDMDAFFDAVWSRGSLYLCGVTESSDLVTLSGRQASRAGSADAFVVVLQDPYYQPDLQIQAGGTTGFVGADVYSGTGANQVAAADTPADLAKSYLIRVQNDGNQSDSFRITGTGGGTGWTVVYYNAATGGTDITSQVTGGGYTTGTIATGASTDLRVEVTPAGFVADGDSFTVTITGTSTTSGSRVDAVRATTTRVLGPSLGFAGTVGYEADGVEPDSGFYTTTFDFRALYTDAGGAPAQGLQLHVYKDGQEIGSSPYFNPTIVSGTDPVTGIVYQWTVAGLTKGGTYSYRFEAQNGTFQAAGPLTVELPGPSVANTPPSVTGVAISPANPLTSDDLTVIKTFTDPDPGDTEAGSEITWTINGAVVTNLTDPAVLPAARTNMQDVIGCTYRPSDGEEFGAAVNADPVTVQLRTLQLTSAGTVGVVGRELMVTATLLGDNNVPVGGELVTFASSTATISSPQVLTDANGVAQTTVLPALGNNTISASSGGATEAINVIGRQAQTTTIELLGINSPDGKLRVIADVDSVLRVRVTEGGSGQPIVGMLVTAERVAGTTRPESAGGVTDGTGEARITMNFALGNNQIRLTAGDAQTTEDVIGQAGPISRARSTVIFERDPARVPGDGQTPIVMTVTLRDANGNPVAFVPAGSFSASSNPDRSLVVQFEQTGEDGISRATVRSTRAGDTVVTVRVRDPLTGQSVILTDSLALTILNHFVLHLLPGLNLVGTPVVLDDPAATTVWRDVSPMRVARYVPASNDYRMLNPLAPTSDFDVLTGRAFWVRTSREVNVALDGEPGVSDRYTVPLSGSLWTLASVPTVNALRWDSTLLQVSVNDVVVGTLAESAEFVAPYVWLWNAARQQNTLVIDGSLGVAGSSDVIPAGSGIWVRRGTRSLGSGVAGLVFDIQRLSRASGRQVDPQPTPAAWALRLSAEAAGMGSELTVGVASKLTGRLEITPPPAPEQQTVSLAIVDPVSGRSYAGQLDSDVIGAGGREWRLRATTQAGDEPVTISWAGANRQVPRDYRVILTDLTSGRSVALSSSAALVWQPRGERSRDYLLRVERRPVDRLAVSVQARPGRSRSVTLALTLSQPATVRMRVLGLSGRVVKEWTVGELAAGTAALSWDGTDSQGRRVPAGTYRVEAWAENDLAEKAVATVTVPIR